MTAKISHMKQSELNRAKFAYECVSNAVSALKEVKELNFQNLESIQKNKYFKISKYYKSYVKKVPSLIQVNGLAGTFAFIYSKMVKNKDGNEKGTEKNPYKDWDLIYFQVWEWLNQNYKSNEKSKELIEWIIEQNSEIYKAVTIEVLALFSWLKRFAEGMIEVEENNE
jgi:CRISPR-associated protein Cmr5